MGTNVTLPPTTEHWRKALLREYLRIQREMAFRSSHWDKVFAAAELPERRWEDDGGGPR